MVDIYFKIKSSWFRKGVIKKMKEKGFTLYCLLEQFKCKNTGVTYTCINKLYKDMKDLGLNCSKNDIVSLLKKLKSEGSINFNRNTRFDNYNDLLEISFTDAPETHRESIEEIMRDIPNSSDDAYLVVDTAILNFILQQGLTVKHFIVYLAIKKYSYAPQNTVSCETISEWTGFGIHQINEKYIPDLERIELIKNNISRNALGHMQNNFKILR
jgi:hypothetical protein